MAEAASAANAPVVLESRAGGVMTIRMNRPDRLNALNVALGQGIRDALRRAADDPETKVVVLTGAGRAFCAGGDIALLQDARSRNAAHELEGLLRAGMDICMTIATMEKPVIAAINGPAAGGGMNLALACDMRIASEQAVFAESFVRIGLFPDFGGTYFLPRLVGPSKAAELFWTGDIVSAAEALRLGIVNRVVPQERLEAETTALATQLATGPAIAVCAIKSTVFARDSAELLRALELEAEQQKECFRSEDAAEGFEAFFAKRPPKFRVRYTPKFQSP